jgi:ribonuclease J
LVTITFYDGVNCIGGNKILLEDNGSALLLDFGTNYGAEGMYFDEFLTPRITFGFSDLLALGILPPLPGLYRLDLEYPGVWEKYSGHPLFRQVEAQGLLLSHAHYDHCGYITYLREDIPIYSSLTTAFLCKVLQDTAGSSRPQEMCYIARRELKDGLLKSSDYRKNPFEQRPYFVMGPDGPSNETVSFWQRCDASRGLNCRPLSFCGEEAQIGGLTVRFWPVDHSVPGAGAFAIKTSAGWIVYTGDLRLHGKKAYLTRQFMKEAAKLNPVALICEGTHPRVDRPVTEEQVAANCFDAVKAETGLVVADFGPRNVGRLLSFLEIAGDTGRFLVLTSKDVYLLEALKAAGEPEIPDPYEDGRIVLYVKPKGQRDRWEEALIARFSERAPARVLDAGRIKADPGFYILCFSYYDFHALLDISPEGGTYIYSSSEAFNEEMLLDHRKVENWIHLFDFKLYGNLGENREKSGFHASGHIHGPGIEELVQTIRPEVLVPIHTESLEFFRRFEGSCRVVYPEKGAALCL